MGRLLKWSLGLCLIFCLYWAFASYSFKSGIAAWFDDRQRAGWQAEYTDLASSGFPFSHQTDLTGVALADPATGVAWQADSLRFESPAWWPGHMTLDLPDTPQLLSYFDDRLILQSQDTVAEMRLIPGTSLMLETLNLTSGPWSIAREDGTLVAASGLVVGATQLETSETYQFEVSAEAFRPGDIPRTALRLPLDWPVVWDALEFDMTVEFDRPWDRTALDVNRPQPRVINLKLAEAKWGALRLFMAGDVTVDQSGIPTGEIAIKAENWREMLDLAVISEVMTTGERNTIETALNFLGGLGGNPNALDLKLGLSDGFIRLGPLPLGPAPRLILR